MKLIIMKTILSLLVIFISSILNTHSQGTFKPSLELGDEYRLKGDIDYINKDYLSAIEKFTISIFAYPKPDEVLWSYRGRGDAKVKLNFIHEAILDYNKCIEISPKYAEAYLGRGICMEELKDFRGAILDFNKSLQFKYFNEGLLLYHKGFCEIMEGEKENGCKDLNRSFDLGYAKSSEFLKKYCN